MNLTNGFAAKQFAEIKKEIEQSLISSLGEINLLAPSVFANIIAVFAEREANLWEQMVAIYNAANPNSAEGYSLDGICALSGVVRSSATYSEAIVQLTALNYTKIPKHSEILVKNSNNLFALTEDITVTNEKCCSIQLKITSGFKAKYELTLNKQVVTHIKGGNESVDSIASALTAKVNAANLPIEADVSGELITLKAKNYFKEFCCFVSDGIAVSEITNNSHVIASKKGSIAAPVHSLTNIHTPISGWIAVTNLSAAKIGNDLESDKVLRARRELSIKLGGSGTLEAIIANLLNLNTVTAVTIFENTTDKTNVNNIAPHSFEALVTGGNELEIAQVIWQKKPAGIRTSGKIAVGVSDSTNKTQIINFSRPEKCFIHAKITITKTKDFIANTELGIKANIIQQINSLGVNQNVILKSLFVSIFSSLGIAGATIELGGTIREGGRVELGEADIKIKESQVAFTDSSKIEIILKEF